MANIMHSLCIMKKMLIKASGRWNSAPTLLAIREKVGNTRDPYTDKDMEKVEILYIDGGSLNGHNHYLLFSIYLFNCSQ